MLLYSLPESNDNFICAIESRDNLPDAESLKVKILEEYHARKQKWDENSNEAMFVKGGRGYVKKSKGSASAQAGSEKAKTNSKPKYACGYCKKKGHKESECFSKKNAKRANQEESESANLCFLNGNVDSTSQPTSGLWCIDSGSTSHLCCNESAFTHTSKINSKLNLANNSTTLVTAKGDVRISVTKNMKEAVTLKDTLYVPDLRTNLISVSKIVDNNYEVTFKKESAIIKDSNGDVKTIAKRIGDLFFLREYTHTVCAASEQNDERSIDKWHARLGHLNEKDLIQMLGENMVSGIKFDKSLRLSKCDVCLAGKIASTPFPKRESTTNQPLEIIHTDVCGPMRTISNGGARYFITFVDDYSRWCQVYFLKEKSQVIDKFLEFKNFVENQKGYKIKAIQSDNGKEFCNRRMSDVLKREGIQHRLTVPYTPQQNGIAERKNRTLVEMARCMLIQSGLPKTFWAEAITTANYIRNRCPTKGISDGIPYNRWIGEKPDISNLHTFGEEVYILDKNPSRGKFDPKGIKGIFVGYSEKSKGFRIWLPCRRNVCISRDVKFLDKFNSINNSSDSRNQIPDQVEVDFDNTNPKLPLGTEEPLPNYNQEPLSNYDQEPFQGFSQGEVLPHEELHYDVELPNPSNVANLRNSSPKRLPGRPRMLKPVREDARRKYTTQRKIVWIQYRTAQNTLLTFLIEILQMTNLFIRIIH